MIRHGLNRPFHILQKSLWVFLIILLVLNEISITPILPSKWQVTFNQIFYTVIYHTSFAAIIIFGFLATFIDPTDSLSTLNVELENKKDYTYCTICKSSRFLSSKHCGKCNRCVHGFDHHCKWINNCIGKKNYKCFICALAALTINTLTVICTIIIVLLDFYIEDQNIDLDIRKRIHNFENNKAWIAETMVLSFFCLLCFLLSCNLLFFHIYINIKGITTYEHVFSKMNRIKVMNQGEIFIRETGSGKKQLSEITMIHND